jgi:hypothetical protein
VRQNLAMASSDPTSGGDGDRDVFGSLPNSRPQRRSAKRDRGGAKATPAAAPAATEAQTPTAKPKAKAGAAKAAKPAAARAKAKPKARASAKAEQGAGAGAAPAAAKIPPAGYATPRTDDDGVPRGADLVTTAVQAAGELAQIGLAAGGRALKSALERLPRP